mgnify:CR=1 FL=1
MSAIALHQIVFGCRIGLAYRGHLKATTDTTVRTKGFSGSHDYCLSKNEDWKSETTVTTKAVTVCQFFPQRVLRAYSQIGPLTVDCQEPKLEKSRKNNSITMNEGLPRLLSDSEKEAQWCLLNSDIAIT